MMSEVWANWAGSQRCAPAAIERPASEDELAKIVAGAAARGQQVRAVGAGHSFTDIACTDGVMVDLSAMGRLLSADQATGLVTVQAGIRLHALGPRGVVRVEGVGGDAAAAAPPEGVKARIDAPA
jgi:L-gulonolactone oxidase